MAQRKGFSRRGFLGTAGVAGAGAAACGTPGGGDSAAAEPPGGVWERPKDQRDSGNRRNLILLNVDTFRADNLQCYGGNGLVRCPRLDAFAEDSVIFDHVYPEAMPTIPIRRVLFTGRRILPYYQYYQHEPVQLPGWHELYFEDQTMAEALHESGYTTAFIADIPHLQRPGKNFHRGYRYYEWSRGHEVDYYAQAPPEMPDMSDYYPDSYLNDPKLNSPENNYGFNNFLRQFKANRLRYEKEAESLIEVAAKNVIAWLKRNADKQPFFLHLEGFDPHEPWDPPESFLRKYWDGPREHTWWEPPYANIDIPEEGVNRLRANYAGESMCVDYWLGEILDTIEELGLYDNSIVSFWSDHGALLGEQGEFLKGPERIRRQVCHNPWLVRLPGKEKAGEHVKGFINHPDMMPTLMDWLDLDPPKRVTGQSAVPLVNGETNSLHEDLVQAYGWIAAIQTEEWNCSIVIDAQRYGTQKTYGPQLYNKQNDPDELTNVADQHPDVVAQLTKKIEDYWESGRGISKGWFHPREGYQNP